MLMTGWSYIQVLVDAECTHDGSIKHIQNFEHWGWTTLQRRVLDAERTDSLTTLQVSHSLFQYVYADNAMFWNIRYNRHYVLK